MAALSTSKAPADVETAATSLGKELIQVKALPGGSAVPDAVGKAGNYLLQIIQQHKEKQAARAMDQTLTAVGISSKRRSRRMTRSHERISSRQVK